MTSSTTSTSKNQYATDDDDDMSSVSSANSNTEAPSEESEQPVKIADEEAKWVWRSKILVFIVIICATTLCAFAVYRFTSNEETKNFEYQVSTVLYYCMKDADFVRRTLRAQNLTNDMSFMICSCV